MKRENNQSISLDDDTRVNHTSEVEYAVTIITLTSIKSNRMNTIALDYP